MLYKTLSAAVYGIDANIIQVEVDCSGIKCDQDHFHTVGLPDAAVRESRDRVRAALKNCGYDIPPTHITINLAPADIKKEGSGFDLPMALGIVGAYGGLTKKEMTDCIFVGELSLDGGVRCVRGALPIALEARGRKISRMVVPEANAKEAAMVGGLDVYPVRSLLDVIHFVNSGNGILPVKADGDSLLRESQQFFVDFKDVRGQQTAKRAIEIACAGGHNILMIGPPGSGKTMLAKRMPTILPPFTFEEALETTKIHSVAGVLDQGSGLVGTRPYRSPHHTISDAGLIGGGVIPRPGEVSLAHNGLLFLDELPEFPRNVLEVLRQPLEDGTVSIARASMSLTFPARFMLAAAMNPCPCGFHSDRTRDCQCTTPMIQRYVSKISRPLMDRIDIHIDVPAVNYKEMRTTHEPENSATIRERVIRARQKQLERFSTSREKLYCNAQMSSRHIRAFCELSPDCERLLERAMTQQGLSARAHDRILKVARTVADLEESLNLEPKHIAEAIQYRSSTARIGRKPEPSANPKNVGDQNVGTAALGCPSSAVRPLLSKNALPFGTSGRAATLQADLSEAIPLLLVVHRAAFELFALRIGSTRCGRAGLAIRRDHNSAADRNLFTFLDSESQGVIINLLVRPRIRSWIPGDGIIFAVKLPRPFAMRGLPGGVSAIDRDFYVVTRGLKDDCAVLRHPRSDLRLGLIQLPGSDLCVAGETHCPCHQAQSKSQYARFYFHVASIANKVWDWFTARILVLDGAFCNYAPLILRGMEILQQRQHRRTEIDASGDVKATTRQPSHILYWPIFESSRRISMSEANKAVIRSFVTSVNTHNWDSLRILLAPQFIRHSNAGGTPEIRSAEELITYLKNEYVTFPDAEETLLDLVAEGESVAARSQFRGTQLGRLSSYPASGKVLSATYLAIYRLEGGRIAEAWSEWDNLYGLQQLGHHNAT